MAGGAAVLHGVLEDDVALLVDAVEQAVEVAAVVDADEHPPEQQLPELRDDRRAAAGSIHGRSGAVAVRVSGNRDGLGWPWWPSSFHCAKNDPPSGR